MDQIVLEPEMEQKTFRLAGGNKFRFLELEPEPEI